jgi:hypothetical protein
VTKPTILKVNLQQIGVSINGGTQKRMVYLIEKPIQIDDMGVLTILRNHQIMTEEE